MNYIDFEKRKIALIGISSQCKHFYMQFHSVLNIKYYFATELNQASPKVKEYFDQRQGVKYMPMKEEVIRDENLLLVLCVGHDFRKRIDKVLFNKGFEWGIDYIDALYVIQFYRNKYNIQLEQKNIWIFGAGNIGKAFYNTYKHIYSISGFISNYEEETEYLSLPVIRPEDILKQENIYIVICSGAEDIMSDQLAKIGCLGYRDYSFGDMLPKKLFIAIGSCQIGRVASILNKNSNFKGYDICLYRDSMYVSCGEMDNERLKGYGTFCDVVFYNIVNVGSLEERNYEPVLNQYFAKAERLSMPFYYFRGQLMQASETENKYTIVSQGVYYWLRGDNEINRMIEEGYTKEKIKKEILKTDYWTDVEIIKNFEKELKKIDIWDRFSSFPIKPFIEENYKNMIVFSDGTHFNSYLELYLADEIAKHFNLGLMDDMNVLKEIEEMKNATMPVYPCVQHALGMRIGDSCKFCTEEEGWKNLSFEEFIDKYVEYVIHIKNIHKKLGMKY